MKGRGRGEVPGEPGEVGGVEQRWVTWLKLVLAVFLTALAAAFITLTLKGAREVGAAADGRGMVTPYVYPRRAAFPDLVRELAGLEVYPLRPSWELDVGGGQTKFSLEEGRLYVTSSTDAARSSLYCLDAYTGEVLWGRVLDSWISCAPRAWEDKLYVGTTSHVLYAFDAVSGALLWSFTAQGEILTTPAFDGEVIFFFADNNAVFGLSNRLYALDARSGVLLWTYETASWTPSPPTIGHGLVFTAGSMSTVLALDRNTGREVWTRPVDSVVFSCPLLEGDRVYVATVNGRLCAFDAFTGRRLWSVEMFHFTPSIPRLAGHQILLDRCPDRILAFSTGEGRPEWSLGGDPLLATTRDGDASVVYAYFLRGRLLEVDADAGRCLRIYVCDFDLPQQPLVNGGWAYCVSSDGKVRACPLPGQGAGEG